MTDNDNDKRTPVMGRYLITRERADGTRVTTVSRTETKGDQIQIVEESITTETGKHRALKLETETREVFNMPTKPRSK